MDPSCAESFLRRRVAGCSFDNRSASRLNDIAIVLHLRHGYSFVLTNMLKTMSGELISSVNMWAESLMSD